MTTGRKISQCMNVNNEWRIVAAELVRMGKISQCIESNSINKQSSYFLKRSLTYFQYSISTLANFSTIVRIPFLREVSERVPLANALGLVNSAPSKPTSADGSLTTTQCLPTPRLQHPGLGSS